MQLYQITDIGTDYIQSNDIFEIAAKTPIIGTAEFILECFKCKVFELDGMMVYILCLVMRLHTTSICVI